MTEDSGLDDRDAEGVVTRSEEVMTVGTVPRISERVRLRKRVVTEVVTQTVELRREELVIEREPVSADSPTGPAFDGADSDYEIVLHEERVQVTKQVVPVERIRIGTQVVTDVVEVADELRREQIDVVTSDGPEPPGR